jgi:hypothetical protein
MGGVVLNPAARARVERIGAETQPVLVIDDALAELPVWRAAAESGFYCAIGPHYPGVRAAVPAAMAQALADALAPIVAGTFGAPAPPLFESYFSIVTTPPDRLAPIQRLPHFDGVEAERIAILVFLSGAGQGGTAFYRQRATGFESVTADRFQAFSTALQVAVRATGLPPAAYIAGDTPIYERIACYDAAPNRVLVYRGNSLHCAAIPAGAPLPADPREGRLSINSFLFDPAAAGTVKD